MGAASRSAAKGLALFLCVMVWTVGFGPTAKANPKYAAMVYDVNAGETLFSRHADAKRFPASLTKIMTLYIVFEEIEAGRLTPNTKMAVSKYAAARPPSKIGVKAGGTIRVKHAIKALVTKSANDVATVIAEHISGSEAKFARRMTRTARRLGMTSTTFRNPHGLPNAKQRTTARDMVRLGVAVQRDFPQHYGVFSTRVFKFGKRRFGNHNRLLGRVKGVDGIKTGYIRASGFNLVTSVKRDGRHLVAVVMGGRSGASRNKHMTTLVERWLPKATKGRALLLASARVGPAPIPSAKPARSVVFAKLKSGESDPIAAQVLAFAAQTREAVGTPSITTPRLATTALSAVIAQAEDGFANTPAVAPAATTTAAATPPAAPTATAAVAAPAPLPSDRVGVILARVAPEGRTPSADTDRIAGAFDTMATVTPSPAALDRRALEAAIIRAGVTGRATAPAAAKVPATPVTPAQTATISPPPRVIAAAESGWQIQLGAVDSPSEAAELLDQAAEKLPALRQRERVTMPVDTGSGTLFRARFAGFASQKEANAACKRFTNHNRPCWAVSM
ncbi:MAG: D-alanyl-D-alanine carboxypeptidase [Pseudomonadota bacterium]